MESPEKTNEPVNSEPVNRVTSTTIGNEQLINASGHVQELDRNFGLLSLAGLGITVGCTWPALAGSILVAIYNGGAPGVIYEFIVVSIFYWLVAASIAELASSIPSSGGVYHWASVTPGKKWGRVVGFFAGYWNWLAWVFGQASMSAIAGNLCVQMYAATHPDFEAKAWHVFVTYLLITWLSCFCVCCFNKVMPHLNLLGIVLIIGGVFITIVVVAAMPGHDGRPAHASNAFVWKDWNADIGYPSGFVFCLGLLNGAFAVGTPDCTAHCAEELPRPARNVPIAIAMQMGIGFITSFVYIIAILYAINDYDALFDSAFPIAEIYRQATGSSAGTVGLLVLIFLCIILTNIGVYITAGRTFWTLARDKATPVPEFFSKVDPRLGMPMNATLLCCALITILGCIYVGSTTAFNAFIDSFVVMSSVSYIAAILPHLLTRRKNIVPGPFWMKGWIGFVINFIACAYMITWDVIYCFPFALPTNAQSMNYSSLIVGGFTVFIGIWWFIGARKNYVGPQTAGEVHSAVEEMRGHVDKDLVVAEFSQA